MKVLVVEDEQKISSFVEKGLEDQGFTVTVADSGEDGYKIAASEAVDVIVLDIMLPGRDGLSVVKQLREEKITTPITLRKLDQTEASGTSHVYDKRPHQIFVYFSPRWKQ